MRTIKLLKRIWTEDIAKDFEDRGLINERTLQAALYHHLRDQGDPELGVRLEVQEFKLGMGIPDMVIVRATKSARMVEAVIELKLLPRNKGIVYEGDIRKLVGWAQAVRSGERSDRFDVDPATLNWTGERYVFTKETNWIFAAVGTNGSDGLDPKVLRNHAKNHADKKGADIGELNLWLFPGVLGEGFRHPVKL